MAFEEYELVRTDPITLLQTLLFILKNTRKASIFMVNIKMFMNRTVHWLLILSCQYTNFKMHAILSVAHTGLSFGGS